MAEFTNVYGAYWRIGYWLSSVPVIKMMQCAVTRRRTPSRKRANLLHGPRSPGLATIIATKDQQGEQVVANHSHHLPVRLLKSQPGTNGSLSLGIKALDDSRVADGANVADGLREQAHGEESLTSGPLQSVCLANSRRHYPYSKVADVREARWAPLERKMVVRKPKSSSLSPFARQRVVPEKLTADDITGKFAYISLDGRLINAELATSASNIGGGLGAEEAQAWEAFAPMYRILIAALSAAASSAAKDKNSIEIQRLLKIVTEQEKELVHMRQQLSDQLCFQTITDPGNLDSRTELLEWASPTDTGEASLQNLKSPVHSQLRHVEGEEADGSVVARDAEYPNDSPFKLSVGDLQKTRCDPVNKSIVLVETPLGKDLTSGIFRSLRETNSLFEKSAHDEAKWYVNPMVDAAEDYYDMQTPARDNPIFSTCTPAFRRSFEWTASRSSVKKRDKWTLDPRLSPLAELVPASPLQVIPCRLSKESITPSMENRNVDEEVTALRVQCAAALLKLKTKVMTVVRMEGARCVAERNIRATEGKALVASLVSAVAGCWRETVPQALAALGLSPSEYNSCLLSSTQRTKTNDLECARETDGWRQYLEEYDISEQEAEQKCSRVAALCLCASNFHQLSVCKSLKNNRLSEGSSERGSVNLLGAREADEESTCSSVNVGQAGVVASESLGCDIYEESIAESQSKFVHCWENPSEWLDKASTEVADMEMQIKPLQEAVSEFEAEGDNSKSNLVESVHLENQAKLHHNIVDLGARLQLKGVQFMEMLGSPKSRLRQEVETVGGTELKRELELKELEILELTCLVQAKDDLIADMESNMHAALEDMARELQSKEYKILELKSEVQLRGLEVAGLERKLEAKLSLDVAEMTRQLQLMEAKFVELTTSLHMKDLVIADLERAQKVILMAKDEELSVLLEDRIRSDAQLHEVTAAVQATEIAVSDRITTLEDLCSRKDFKIFEMKQELQFLKFRSKPLQSPNMLRNRRSTISYIPREPHYVVEETSSPPTSRTSGPADPPCEDIHDASVTEAGPPPSEECPLVDVTSVSTSSERDDAKESGEAFQNDKENVTETTVSSNPQLDRNNHTSKIGSRAAKQSTSNSVVTKPKPKRATADASRNTTSLSANATGANRVRASMTFTSSGGAKHSSKSNSVVHPVVISKKLRRKVIISPVRGQKPLVAVTINTPVNRKSQKHGVDDGAAAMDDRSKESSVGKRRRWAA